MCRLLTRPDRAAHHPAAPAEVRHVDHAEHIEGFMHDIAAGKTAGRGEDQATRSIGRAWRPWCRRAHCSHCRGAIFTYAVSKGLRIDNPVRGVVKYATGRRERRLTDDEVPA